MDLGSYERLGRRLRGRELAAVTAALAADPAVRARARHDPEQRWYTKLHATEWFEVWLLGWDVEQRTELHDHGGSSGAFSVCAGTLSELHTEGAGGRLGHRVHPPGTTRSLGPAYVHDLSNRGPGVAARVHAYSPPLRLMNYYGFDQTGGLTVTRTEDVTVPEQGGVLVG